MGRGLVVIWLARYWKPLALVAAIGCLYLIGYTHGRGSAEQACEARESRALAEAMAAKADAERRAREASEAKARAIAEIDRGHDEDKARQAAAYERDLADLRNGNLKLRQHWRGCQATSRLSAAATAPGEPDAGAELRAEGAADLVRAAREADDWIKRLQQVIREDRR